MKRSNNENFLFQILVPVSLENGRERLEEIHHELQEKFGGVTSYSRAPAEGLWEESPQRTIKDQIVVVEIMTDIWDEGWWQQYKHLLERRLAQKEIVIRCMQFERI